MKNVFKKNEQGSTDQYKKLIIGLAERASRVLDETWSLWEIDPSSKELRDKFYVLEECLDHIKRVCEESM